MSYVIAFEVEKEVYDEIHAAQDLILDELLNHSYDMSGKLLYPSKLLESCHQIKLEALAKLVYYFNYSMYMSNKASIIVNNDMVIILSNDEN